MAIHTRSPALPPRLSCTASSASSREILVVDDEPHLRRMLKSTLLRSGFQVEAVATPGEALELIGKSPHRFAILLTDLDMPKMCGLELATRVKTMSPRIGIILHTGTALSGDGDPRVDLIIPKPASIDDLSSAIIRLLDEREPPTEDGLH